MTETLKPCPFCGGEALIDRTDAPYWAIECQSCKILLWPMAGAGPDESIAAWNRRASDWQPIETAPREPCAKPGITRSILLASVHGHMTIGYWNPVEQDWWSMHDHRRISYWNALTHWQPLPEPPEGQP